MPVASSKPANASGSGPVMGSIAQSIYNQMSMAGKPRTTTTTVEEPIIDEPLNIGQLGILISLLLQKSQYQPTGAAAGAAQGLTSDQIQSLFNAGQTSISGLGE